VAGSASTVPTRVEQAYTAGKTTQVPTGAGVRRRDSLSKAWRLDKRFSENIDFKVAMPAGTSRNKADGRTVEAR
jgi:hypothetical protein